MKIKYLKLKHWLIAVGAAALGMNVGSERTMMCEYGTPEATYHVKGRVTAPDGTPVPGIEVSQNWGAESRHPFDTTDAQGNFKTTVRSFPWEQIQLTFTDIDSTENGSYCDTSLNIPTRDIPLSGGDGHWYGGEGTVNVDVTLTAKS